MDDILRDSPKDLGDVLRHTEKAALGQRNCKNLIQSNTTASYLVKDYSTRMQINTVQNDLSLDLEVWNGRELGAPAAHTVEPELVSQAHL